MTVHAILEDSALDAAMKKWDELDLTWNQLSVLPKRWQAKIAEWRGIYYIFDASDGKGYVGSAYGPDNLLGRWRKYAASGHGGNRHLRERDPQHFHFTILELVSPTMDAVEVIRRENTWKERTPYAQAKWAQRQLKHHRWASRADGGALSRLP